MTEIDLRNGEHVMSSVNSYLGVLSHSASYHLRQDIFSDDALAKIVEIDADYLKCRAA